MRRVWRRICLQVRFCPRVRASFQQFPQVRVDVSDPIWFPVPHQVAVLLVEAHPRLFSQSFLIPLLISLRLHLVTQLRGYQHSIPSYTVSIFILRIAIFHEQRKPYIKCAMNKK